MSLDQGLPGLEFTIDLREVFQGSKILLGFDLNV